MSRMKSLLERQALQLFESMETDASEVLSQVVVTGASSVLEQVQLSPFVC